MWLLSLQLGVYLAADDVQDLMTLLKPVRVKVWIRAAYEADGDGKEYNTQNELWQREVTLPAAMLVSTMHELSAWCDLWPTFDTKLHNHTPFVFGIHCRLSNMDRGSGMGAAIGGCLITCLGMLPTAAALDDAGMIVVLLVRATTIHFFTDAFAVACWAHVRSSVEPDCGGYAALHCIHSRPCLILLR